MSALPTILVIHPKERRSKCSVEPLRGRDDFQFVKYPRPVEADLSNYVRLGMGGDVLSAADADKGLLVLDGTWRLASKMEPDYQQLPIRSLPVIQTAYPRVSKISDDPSDGLATIEAVYAALKIMGRSVDGLLDDYHWKAEFLEINEWAVHTES
ncbi:MAG: DUF367 domain-containing protein [Fuerstiella sp.]